MVTFLIPNCGAISGAVVGARGRGGGCGGAVATSALLGNHVFSPAFVPSIISPAKDEKDPSFHENDLNMKPSKLNRSVSPTTQYLIVPSKYIADFAAEADKRTRIGVTMVRTAQKNNIKTVVLPFISLQKRVRLTILEGSANGVLCVVT